MGTGDDSSVAERLRWAIDRMPPRGRERGLRLFQRRMKARAPDLEGVTLPSIQRYVRGDYEPSLAFLREAAVILEVRPEWLAFGSGFPTEAEQSAAREVGNVGAEILRFAASAGGVATAYRTLIGSALEEAVPRWWDLPDAARGAALRGFETYRRLASTLDEYGDMTPGESAPEMARRYGAYLAAPFELLGLDAGRLGPVERALILDAMLRPLEVAGWNETTSAREAPDAPEA